MLRVADNPLEYFGDSLALLLTAVYILFLIMTIGQWGEMLCWRRKASRVLKEKCKFLEHQPLRLIRWGCTGGMLAAAIIIMVYARMGIEILMLTAAALILILTKTDGIKATQGSIFPAGMQAVIAIFGIAWMGDTFINGNITQLTASIEGIVTEMPWLFGAALFVMSILLYSQAATVRAIVPLGIALGMSPMMLIALFPAVNGYFFIPNYPTVVAAINFDRTGTTGIGKYILNHSFMMPGLVATVVSLAVGLLLIQVF